MVHVARYHALIDTPRTLDPGETTSVVFNPPNDIVRANSGVDMPYISFIADPDNNAQNLALRVHIKPTGTAGLGAQLVSLTLSGGVMRTMNELVSGQLISLGDNTITFHHAGGSGSVVIKGAIFHFIRTQE